MDREITINRREVDDLISMAQIYGQDFDPAETAALYTLCDALGCKQVTGIRVDERRVHIRLEAHPGLMSVARSLTRWIAYEVLAADTCEKFEDWRQPIWSGSRYQAGCSRACRRLLGFLDLPECKRTGSYEVWSDPAQTIDWL